MSGQTFTVTQAASSCAFAISPTSQSVIAGGGGTSTAVSTSTGCGWTATSNAAWLTITGGASGTGNGTVNVTAAANAAAQTRSGTLTVAGRTFTVNQAAAACSYAISPASQSVVAGGGSGSSTVTAQTGCAWTAVSNASFITLTSGASGSGNGSAAFSIQANSATTQRTGTLTIAGRAFTVTQAGAACSYAITPPNRTMGSGAATGSIGVTTAAGCAWTARSNAAWITTVSAGSGNGSATFAVLPNPGTAPRTGTITLATQTFTITQSHPTAPGVPGGLRVITQ
jgi:hypothetical protein